MSSNIKIQRKCEFCDKSFIAKTTVTRFCSDVCAKKAYKEKQRKIKIAQSSHQSTNFPGSEIKDKEFLTVREAAALLSCSIRTIYNYIEQGVIKAGNPSQRMTRIPRSEINRLFS
jgi:excisionase family DNA binding protein